MPTVLQETDKISSLFKAFHAHNLKNKRQLCDELRELIDNEEIRGSEQIGTLLCKLISEEIDNEELEEAVCKVLDMKEHNLDDFRKDPDYDANSTDDDNDTDDGEHDDDMEDDIQLAQRVPEMNEHNDHHEHDHHEHAHHNNGLSKQEKAEIAHLCKTMREQFSKMEQACVHGCANRACDEINRMKAYFDNYVEVIKFIVHN